MIAMTKKLWYGAILLVMLLMLWSVGVGQAFAAVSDTGFADVDADDWYAEAITYCDEQGLMSGNTETSFAPNETMSRAMLATVLYREAGEPAVSGSSAFADVVAGQWYSDAVLWAEQNEIINGYENGLFGTNDPITREQMITILWRYSDSPAVSDLLSFADVAAISDYAEEAVAWGVAADIIGGKPGNLFDPSGNATRAEAATILMHFVQMDGTLPDQEPTTDSERNILIAYFSHTGNTETIANFIQQEIGGDLFEITTVEPYPEDYDTLLGIAEEEQNADARPVLASTVDQMSDYEIVFVGYPIWWGNTPMAVRTFLESYDFSDKIVIPFCTHGSSGFGQSIASITALIPEATLLDGLAISGSAAAQSQEQVNTWLAGLDLPENTSQQSPEEVQSVAGEQIRLTFGDQEAVITLEDNAASRHFVSLLPLTLTFEDYAGSEKIATLPEALPLDDTVGLNPQAGDVAFYEPWGNIAIFYQNGSASNSLMLLGRVTSGLSALADMAEQTEIHLSLIED